jgi:predicted membrane-bound mannosyltransferase
VAKTKKQKSPSNAAEKQLKAVVKRLRTQLAAAEGSAEKWKARAKDHRSFASGAKAELMVVRRRLERAEASVTKWKDRAKSPAPAAPVTATLAPAASSVPTASNAPDESWTVTALRAEARRRGVTGYSRKTKAQLLADLRG